MVVREACWRGDNTTGKGENSIVFSVLSPYFIAYQLSGMPGGCDDMSKLHKANKLIMSLSIVKAGNTYFWEHMILGLCEWLTANWLTAN